MRNIISEAINAAKIGQWERWLHSLDNDFLQQILINFKNWREKPNGDFRLSSEELNKRIAIIEGVIASQKNGVKQ